MSWLKKNKILVIFLVIAVAFFAGYNYIYQAHEEVETSTVDYKGNTLDFITQLTENPSKWNNKVVELSGEVTSIEKEGIILNQNVYCQFLDSSSVQSITKNSTANIKGMVIGFDDLFNELKLNQCILVKK